MTDITLPPDMECPQVALDEFNALPVVQAWRSQPAPLEAARAPGAAGAVATEAAWAAGEAGAAAGGADGEMQVEG